MAWFYIRHKHSEFNGNQLNNLFNVINPNGTLGDGYTGKKSQRFNFGALQQLALSLEKESITSTANYDFNEHISAYMQGFFTHKKTGEQLAPSQCSPHFHYPACLMHSWCQRAILVLKRCSVPGSGQSTSTGVNPIR